MGEGLKKTGKIALYIITPTVILLLVLVFIWAYKKYKKKKANAIIVDKKESTLSDATTKNESSKAHIELIERKSGVVKEIKKEEPEEPEVAKAKDDDSKVIDDVKDENKDTKK